MCFFILFVAVAGVIVIAIVAGTSARSAKKEYQDSLGRLKKQPNNPDLREETLRLGRRLSAIVGHKGFDEVVLMNDINAACARATVGEDKVARVELTKPITVSGKSVAQEIEGLAQLFLAGVITADDYERGKSIFLGEPPDKAATAVDLLQNLDRLRAQGILSESEFNIKKWEILSERLMPGKLIAGRLPPPPGQGAGNCPAEGADRVDSPDTGTHHASNRSATSAQTPNETSLPVGDGVRMRVKCDCGASLLARSSLAGKRVKCPACGEAVVIPLREHD